jgi:hypothetical protein
MAKSKNSLCDYAGSFFGLAGSILYGAFKFSTNNRTEIFTVKIKSSFMLPRGNIKVVCVEEKEYNYLNILFY